MLRSDDVLLRPIRPSDDAVVASIIRDVMTEHGASGPGFAIHDPEVGAMSEAYAARERAACFVVESFEHGVLGCAAVAPLEGGEPDVCELRKMYFRPALRGLGAGRRMLRHVLRVAAAFGFARCYLETLASMSRARDLYESEGFARLCAPLGRTGHFACDTQYVRSLDAGLVPDVPVIRTPRLVLRGPRPTDLDAVLTWLADPAAMRFVGDGRPRSRTEAAHFLASSAERFESSGFGFWLVTLDDAEAAARSAASDVPSGDVASGDVPSGDVASGDVPSGDVPSGDVPSGDVPSGDVPSGDVPSGDVPIGDMGIWPIPTSGRRGFRGPELELGYRFALPHHRRGYATEAARALLAHAGEHGLDALVAVTHPENLASQAVLRKCGFTDEGVTERYYDTPCATFAWSRHGAPR